MICPICGKQIDIEKEDREKVLQQLTQMRIKIGKLDREIQSVIKNI